MDSGADGQNLVWACGEESCELTFSGFAARLRHRVTVHVPLPNAEQACREHGCGLNFAWKSDMVAHQKVHVEKAQAQAVQDLARHATEVLGRNAGGQSGVGWVCQEEGCGMRFDRIAGRVRHRLEAHTPARKLCFCGKTFVLEVELATHRATHHEKEAGVWACCEESCGEVFGSVRSRLRHRLEVHTKSKVCPKPGCGETFLSRKKFQAHFETHRQEDRAAKAKKAIAEASRVWRAREWKCEVEGCDSLFTRKFDLLQHGCEEHSARKEPSPGEWACLAMDCGKVFPSVRSLESHHKDAHDGQSLWPCPELGCGKWFRGSSSLKIHRKNDHKRIWKCEQVGCGKVFAWKSTLQSHHSFVHDEHCDWVCEEASCEKRFPSQSVLTRHRRAVHEQLRTWKCDVPDCGKSFIAKYTLVQHRLIFHEGRRDWTCTEDGCEKSFGYKSGMVKHRRSVHEGIRLKCEEVGCEASFNCGYDLSYHQRTTHEGRRDWKCEEPACGKAFSRRRSLNAHRQRVHGVVMGQNKIGNATTLGLKKTLRKTRSAKASRS